MTTLIDYALMAGDSYISNRADINRFPVPSGWVKVTNPDSYARDPASGFEAIAFTNGSEIVISYAGTYGTGGGLLTNPDKQADLAMGLGMWSAQLGEAADYYLQVKAANPSATITLTGHSLGGGLAALIGVFFGVTRQANGDWLFDASGVANPSDSGNYLDNIINGNAGNSEIHINRLDGNDRMLGAANDAGYGNSFERRAA